MRLVRLRGTAGEACSTEQRGDRRASEPALLLVAQCYASAGWRLAPADTRHSATTSQFRPLGISARRWRSGDSGKEGHLGQICRVGYCWDRAVGSRVELGIEDDHKQRRPDLGSASGDFAIVADGTGQGVTIRTALSRCYASDP